jgi:hypothetical protein
VIDGIFALSVKSCTTGALSKSAVVICSAVLTDTRSSNDSLYLRSLLVSVKNADFSVDNRSPTLSQMLYDTGREGEMGRGWKWETGAVVAEIAYSLVQMKYI